MTMADDVKLYPDYGALSREASRLTTEQLYDKTVEASESVQGQVNAIELKAAGPVAKFGGEWTIPSEGEHYTFAQLGSLHEYPTDEDYKRVQLLGQREQIWSSLFEQRIAQELEQKAIHRAEQAVLLPINIARAELEKYLPQAIRQAANELDRAPEYKESEKNAELSFLRSDQKGPMYQMDILRIVGARDIIAVIDENQTPLDRVREMNTGVTESLKSMKAINPEIIAVATRVYDIEGPHGQRTQAFAKQLDYQQGIKHGDYKITPTVTPKDQINLSR